MPAAIDTPCPSEPVVASTPRVRSRSGWLGRRVPFWLRVFSSASGYQNIGLLCANQEQWIFQQHLQGWHKALLRNHMSPHRVINAAQPASFSTGAQQLPEFLLAWPELDALVCASDELAGGALYECQRRRIKVPDNLAVVGFGNSEFSRVCQPPLTTMTIPHRDIGIQAGQALLARLNEQPWQPAGSLPATLCRRDSC